MDQIDVDRLNRKKLFLSQFKEYTGDDYICFLYEESVKEEFHVVKIIEMYADVAMQISPLFLTDSVPLFFAAFKSNNYDYICLMAEALRHSRLPLCELRFFGFTYSALVKKISGTIEYGTKFDKDSIQIKISETGLFKCEEDILAFLEEPMEFWRKQERKTVAFLSRNFDYNSIKYESIYKEVVNSLKAEGAFSVRWVSEYTLYRLVKSFYKSAIYQFKDTWLERQSLDIYIPEINTGIEYQGIQHFQSVEFFGAEEHYEHRLYLDSIKRKKCAQQGVCLIEWLYKTPINVHELRKALEKVGIKLPETRCLLYRSFDKPAKVIEQSTLNTQAGQDIYETLEIAKEQKNMRIILPAFFELVENGDEATVRTYWEEFTEIFSQKELDKLLCLAAKKSTFSYDLLRVAATDNILLDYYLGQNAISKKHDEVFSGAVTALILKMVTLKIENHTIALCVKKVRDLAKSKDFDRNSWKLCDKADERGLNPMTIKEILELAGIPLKKSYIPKSLRKKLQ